MAEEKEKKTVLSQEIKKGLDDIVNKSMKDADTQFTETCNVGFDLALTNGKGLPRLFFTFDFDTYFSATLGYYYRSIRFFRKRINLFI